MKLKKGDKIQVMTGKDKGKIGEISVAFPKTGKILVSGINIVKKHQKAQGSQGGGIIEKPKAFNPAKVLLICPKCGLKTRVGKMIDKNGQSYRICKKCGVAI